jgi:hypothetical protein
MRHVHGICLEKRWERNLGHVHEIRVKNVELVSLDGLGWRVVHVVVGAVIFVPVPPRANLAEEIEEREEKKRKEKKRNFGQDTPDQRSAKQGQGRG